MRLAYILLAHENVDMLMTLLGQLTIGNNIVVVHYDLKSSDSDFLNLKNNIEKNFCDQVFLINRIRVEWGKWSIVEATLNCLSKIQELNFNPDYVHLLSGADYPIKSQALFSKFLSCNKGVEFIEAVNISKKTWVKGGLEHDRYIYKHYFNWRINKKIFDFSYKFQKTFGFKREFYDGLMPHLGSQWWTLTWETCSRVLNEIAVHNDLIDFFKTVWIPDEMFFQTLVGNWVDSSKIYGSSLTYYQFDSNGQPITLYNNHFEYLQRQNFFFARKLSPFAIELRNNLNRSFDIDTENQNFFAIGMHSPEYQRKIQKNLITSNRRIIGISGNEWFSDLLYIKKPYYVILSLTKKAFYYMNSFFIKKEFFILHGELFNKNKIIFCDGLNKYAGFQQDDIILRDHNSSSFLSQILSFSFNKQVGFLYFLPIDGSVHHIIEVMRWHKKARFIFVEESINVFANENKDFFEYDSKDEILDYYYILKSRIIDSFEESKSKYVTVDYSSAAWENVLDNFISKE